jgi:guanylate kinase
MSSEARRPGGVLFVVSAPSGTGKTTVVERLVEICPNLHRSRSYTSRPPRPGEADGVDYNFISRSAFEAMAARDEFLEWADVFGNLYGTARRDTEAALAAGRDVVLVIDVQGANQVRTRVSGTVGIFVLPPSFQTLETRLRGRCQDDPAAIARRLETARSEVSAVDAYEYVVVNDTRDQCVAELAAIVTAERARRVRRQRDVARIVETFES